jgi:hypothetical protein
MKRSRVIVGICFGLLFLASLVAWGLQPAAVDVARAKCIERGWPADDLVPAGFHHTSGWLGLGEHQTVDFVVKDTNPLKRVRVTMRRPVYFLGWQAVDCQEQPGGQ